jgi:hypothetical protein
MTATHLEIAVWAASVLLALLYLIAGGTKAAIPKEKLQRQQRMAYVADLSGAQAPLLSAVAAFALAAVQVVAIVVHLRRREYALVFNLVLFVLGAVVGVGLLVVL